MSQKLGSAFRPRKKKKEKTPKPCAYAEKRKFDARAIRGPVPLLAGKMRRAFCGVSGKEKKADSTGSATKEEERREALTLRGRGGGKALADQSGRCALRPPTRKKGRGVVVENLLSPSFPEEGKRG